MPEARPSHILPALPYAIDALEPHYDKATLEIHHGKHHAAYVEKLNQTLAGHPDLASKPVEVLLAEIQDVPPAIRRKVINNGGGHANHSLFWRILAPESRGGGGAPAGNLGQAIQAEFGSFETFRQKFTDAAMEHFGSGWTFLVQDAGGRLSLRNYPNQDSPISDRLKPLLLVDLWEHAYYLKWKNKKAEWIETWWKMVNWRQVEANHAEEPAWMAVHAEGG
jgi:Fe-Mn family superoxide dismutase